MIVLLPGDGAEHSHIDDLGVPENGVEGSAELMTHRGEEFTLAEVRDFCFFLGALRALAGFQRLFEGEVSLALRVLPCGYVSVSTDPLLDPTSRVEYWYRSGEHLAVFTRRSANAMLNLEHGS